MEKKNHNKQTGSTGEEVAANFLLSCGYRILERNFRCKGGEIDIIAFAPKECSLIFVEVKARRSTAYGLPQQAVNHFKQRQICKAALTWLAKTGQQEHNARFDVVAILLSPDGRHQIEHIKNAFELAY